MVVGLNIFKDFFRGFEHSYLIIGGSACDIIIEGGGFSPRATDDIDLILIVEALSPEFVKRFWDFVAAGDYMQKQKDKEKRNSYRFRNPQSEGFPVQVELFCKTPGAIELYEDAHLTPIPVAEGLSNLSAILLDEDYYRYTIEHSTIDDDVHYANTEALICLKAFAYLDNKSRKEQGQKIQTCDVVKHKNDVFRMVFMLKPDDRFPLTGKLKDDLQLFADTVKDDLPAPQIFNINGFGRQNMQTVIKKEYKYSELTGKIIGCAMQVHRTLGNGFQEVIYQRALAIEMSLADISFSRELEMPIFYREEQIGTRRVDFLVEGEISVELKARTKLEDVHFAQAINYLEAYNLEIGLLINFGETSLNFKRLTNKKYKSPESNQSKEL